MTEEEQKLVERIATSLLPESLKQLLYVDLIVEHASRHAEAELNSWFVCLGCNGRFDNAEVFVKHKCNVA